ncbi:hypothetical protein ACFSYH_10880 [Populibacterium corticicola]|uniref:Uncharacterized protein n=1 Tax=Populibacterium corticicola TaxID=1812826 RepID=A0ABW5XFE3_9MICO
MKARGVLSVVLGLMLGWGIAAGGVPPYHDRASGYHFYPTSSWGFGGMDGQVTGTVALTDTCWTLTSDDGSDPVFLGLPKGSGTVQLDDGTIAVQTPNGTLLKPGDLIDTSGGYGSYNRNEDRVLADLVDACPNVPLAGQVADKWEVALPSLR